MSWARRRTRGASAVASTALEKVLLPIKSQL